MYSSQGERKLLNLQKPLLVRSGLKKESGKIYLKSFIDELAVIEHEVKRTIVKEKVTLAKKFYQNEKNIQKKMLDKWKETAQNEMLLLYRLRNKIVHNAHYDYTILPFYLEKARTFAGMILRYSIKELNENLSLSLKDILLKPIVEMRLIEEKLKNNETLEFK